jgi:hypothetical protein
MSFAAHRRANKLGDPLYSGPRSDVGALVGRLNSSTYDLRDRDGVVPVTMTQAVARHTKEIYAAYRPEGDHQRWLLDQVADAAAKLDHCQITIRALLDDHIDRADLCWDEDRERDIEELAARLPKDPARVARRLRSSAHGCQWLFARWEALGQALVDQGGWNEAQVNLAFHLLGVGPDLRNQYPQLNVNASLDDLSELLCEQLDALQLLRIEALDPLNAKERELTRLGYPLRPSKEFRRLQRYEGQLRRALNDSLNEFRRLQGEKLASPLPIVALEPEPAAEPSRIQPPEPEPEPAAVTEPRPRLVNLLETPAGRSLSAKLAAIGGVLAVESSDPPLTVPMPLPSSPPSLLAAPATPMNRKARRAQAAAGRRAKASVR